MKKIDVSKGRKGFLRTLCNADERIVTLTVMFLINREIRKGKSKLLTVIARLTDMWMGDICFRRCDADIVILFIEFWGCGHRMCSRQ